ncbi:hypothetical protein PV762_04715 [Mitsuaria sp. CC2]|uniref:hypothetical protein n=1 Tax=Mitsuaria sp. CC2 TaxID=3029186 RepID=UPI003B8E8AAE
MSIALEFDVEGALSRLGGDQRLLCRLLDRSREELEGALAGSADPMRESTMAASLHRLRGGALGLGAIAAVKELQLAESALKLGSANEVHVHLRCALESVRRYRERMAHASEAVAVRRS